MGEREAGGSCRLRTTKGWGEEMKDRDARNEIGAVKARVETYRKENQENQRLLEALAMQLGYRRGGLFEPAWVKLVVCPKCKHTK